LGVRIKNARLLKELEDGQKLVEVTLEDDENYQESFVIDLWEMLDEEHFAEVLLNWRNRILKMRKLARQIPAEKAKQVAELAGIEIADTDDKTTLATKITSAIARIKGGNK